VNALEAGGLLESSVTKSVFMLEIITQAPITSNIRALSSSAFQEKLSDSRSACSVPVVWEPKLDSLTTLQRHVLPSRDWENTVWIALWVASLAVVMMSFGF